MKLLGLFGRKEPKPVNDIEKKEVITWNYGYDQDVVDMTSDGHGFKSYMTVTTRDMA